MSILQLTQRLALIVAFAVQLSIPTSVGAQFGGGLAGGGFGGGGGGGIQTGGNQNQQNQGGIAIDAQGVVSPAFSKESNDKLALKRVEAVAREALSNDLNRKSDLRKVSLVRLERACRKFVEAKQHVPPDIQYLAGLQQIEYVFVYPENGDLVVAGPAEGFAPNAIGRVVGVSTGRPPVRLDDLIIALRTIPKSSLVGCSIDAIPENLSRLVNAANTNNAAATPGAIADRFRELTRMLGQQDVSVQGVPPDSHFAQVLVEADYRMKLLALGLDKPKVPGFKSHLDLQRPGETIYQRWWFTPLYDALYTTGDHDAFQFAGQRLQVLSQNEHIEASGHLTDAAFTRLSTQKFAQLMTEHFEKLAAVAPVFAELQNVTDLAILAALIRKERLADRVDWRMELFLDEDHFPLVPGRVPKHVQSVGNWKRSGQLMLAIVGGVTISPRRTLDGMPRSEDRSRELGTARATANTPPDADRWWWD